METVACILTSLSKTGVTFWVEGGQLRYRAPKGSVDRRQIEWIRDRKAEVIEFLIRSHSLPEIYKSLPQRSSPEAAALGYENRAPSTDTTTASSPYWKVLHVQEPWELRSFALDF